MPERALLVIDMLNDFVKEGGTLVVPGAKEKLSLFQKRIEKARKEKELVVYVCDSHRSDDPEFSIWPSHCVLGSWGAEVVEEIRPQSQDYIVRKRRYSAFYGTDLDLYLRENQVKSLILTGLVTNICVMGTAADAASRGYKIEVEKNLVIGLNEEMHQFALRQMKEVYGVSLVESV